jgi:catechol 2,3-dioxygenase-like lactoylglutathione lyase family enzyme
MEYLHTMVRVSDLEASLDFYCRKLGLQEVRRVDNDKGRFTLVFLAAPGDAERAANGPAPRTRRHDQPPAARRAHGVRPVAGRHLDRTSAEGRGKGASRTVGVDAQYGSLVGAGQPRGDNASDTVLPDSRDGRAIFYPGFMRGAWSLSGFS